MFAKPRDFKLESEKQKMGDTPKPGETDGQKPLENNAKPVSAPATDNTDGGSDELAKERAKLEMERRKWQNDIDELNKKLKAKEDAEASAKQKELEEQNEFKTLYEQERAKREDIERERETEEQRKAVAETSQKILADYSDEVKETAKDLGLSLDDVTEEKVAEFKAKLDKIQTRIGGQRVTPNNPGAPSGKKEYSGEELRQILADPAKRDAYYRAKGGVSAYGMQPQA